MQLPHQVQITLHVHVRTCVCCVEYSIPLPMRREGGRKWSTMAESSDRVTATLANKQRRHSTQWREIMRTQQTIYHSAHLSLSLSLSPSLSPLSLLSLIACHCLCGILQVFIHHPSECVHAGCRNVHLPLRCTWTGCKVQRHRVTSHPT